MKIRTDFVTNSSSSCFCVMLTLQFDNDKDKTIRLMDRNRDGDPDFFDDCGRCAGSSVHRWNIMQNFARVVAARDNKGDLFSVLANMCNADGKRQAYILWDSECLTKAELKIDACAYGEYMFKAGTYHMLGIYDEKKDHSIEKAINRLKEQGYVGYTDDALETIILHQDAESSGEYKELGRKRGISYDRNDLSKSITARMNKDGQIDIDIEFGQEYNPGYRTHLSAPTVEIDNARLNELKLKELEWKLQQVREKKARLAEKMQNQ